MGAVDLVTPGSSRHRRWRAGCSALAGPATCRRRPPGVIFPKYQGDLVQSAVVASGWDGDRGAAHPPQPAGRAGPADRRHGGDGRLGRLRAGAAGPAGSAVQQPDPRRAGSGAGHAGLRVPQPRNSPSCGRGWSGIGAPTPCTADRAQRLAVTSGGTIPDRGLFGVFLAGAQRQGRNSHRVGELDEEMVYESRVGDVFVLGASSWRIEDISADQVLVSPAPGQPGRLLPVLAR